MNEFESRDIRDEIDEYIDGRGNNMSREYFEMQNRLNQALEEEREQANLDEKNYNQRVSNQKLMDMYDNAHHNDIVTQKKLENNFRNAHQNDLVTYNKLRKSNPQLANDYLNAFNRANAKDLSNLQRSRDILNKQRPQKMSKMDKALSEALDKAGTKGKLAKAFLKTKTGQKALEKAKKSNPILNGLDKLGNNSEDNNTSSNQNSTPANGLFEIKISPKVIKIAAILTPCVMVVMFMCLFLSSSHIIIKALGLGSADSLRSEAGEAAIKKTIEEGDLDNAPTDEELNTQNNSSISFTIDIDSDFRKSKLQESNLVQIANSKYIERKYNEADLNKLEDFFPNINNLSEKYDEGLAYDFFYKMYNIYVTYRDEYDVYLDLPLLMSTLMIQSDDMNVVFDSNLTKQEKKPKSYEKPVIKYDEDLSSYKPTKTNSQKDMQLLAQNMVSKQVKVTCFDSNGRETDSKILKDDQIGSEDKVCKSGESYETEDLGLEKDDEKYKEFLKKFLEEKYYINEDDEISEENVLDGNYVSDVEFMTGGIGKIYYYNQLDYGSSPYGSFGTIASHGCGPTSLSIAISSLLDEEHNPVELTNHVCSLGGCTNDGTVHATMTEAPKKYGLKTKKTGDTQEVINALAKGNSIVVAIMCPGHFTTGGHFIALTGSNANGKVKVADPASREKSTEWDYNIIVEETCQSNGSPFWIISK